MLIFDEFLNPFFNNIKGLENQSFQGPIYLLLV